MAKTVSKQTLTVGIFALLMASISVYGMRMYFTQEEPVQQEKKRPAPAMLRLPVASTDLPADRVIKPGDLFMINVARDQLRERFKGVEIEQIMSKAEQIVHRRLSKPMQRGQPFLTTKLYLEGTGPSIAGKLQPGYRAMRVAVPHAHDGGVQPGIFTDVIFRANAHPARNGQPAIPETTVTLLRDIEVLEVDRALKTATGKAPEPTGKPTMVTLAVPAEKAGIFGVIDGRGEVWLDPTPVKTPDESAMANGSKSLTLADLLGIQPPPRPAAPPPPFETAIYTGGKLHQVNRFVDGKLVMGRTREPSIRAAKPSAAPENAPTPPAPPAATSAIPSLGQDD